MLSSLATLFLCFLLICYPYTLLHCSGCYRDINGVHLIARSRSELHYRNAELIMWSPVKIKILIRECNCSIGDYCNRLFSPDLNLFILVTVALFVCLLVSLFFVRLWSLLQVATALLVAGSTLTFWTPWQTSFTFTSSYSSIVQSAWLLV